MGKGLKNFFKKVGEAGKKALNGLKNLGEKAINTAKEAALLAAFMPLLPIAIIYLKRRGVTGLHKPSDVIKAVYEQMKKKSFGMSEYRDVFDYSFEDFGYSLEQFGLSDNTEDYGFVVTPEMVTAVIQFLKGIFESIKKKKESGEQLSPDEQEIAGKADEIQQQLSEAKEAAQDILKSEQKSGGTDTKKYIIIGVVALVVILLFVFLVRRK